MARRRQKPGKLYSDSTEHGAMVVCPLCSWRVLESDPARAWRQAYRHFRDGHDALESSKLADRAVRNYYRHQEKEQKGHD